MTRRLLLLALACGIAFAVAPTTAQQSSRVPTVGLLMLAAGPNDPVIERVCRELRTLGYVDGQTIRIEYRGAQGQVDRLPQLAQELVDLKVDVITQESGNQATRMARRPA